MLVFLPGAGEIRRDRDVAARARHRSGGRRRRALRRARRRRAGPRHRARAARPAQGRAGHLDRRDLADHRGRAHRRRLRARARAALRAGRGADPARDRARLARLGRPAPRPRRPHRARRLLSAVGRAADRVARARPTRRKSSPPISRGFVLDLAHWGVTDPAALAFLDPPPRPALNEAKALLRELGAIDADGRITDGGPAAAPTAAAAAACAHGGRRAAAGKRELAAEIALRPDRARARRQRCRPHASARRPAPRPLAPRRRGARDGEALGGDGGARDRANARRALRQRARSAVAGCAARARLSGPHRQEPRRRAARSCSPTAAAPMSIRRRRWRASRFSRSREIAGSAAQGRILLAAPITLAEIESAFRRPHRGPRGDRRSTTPARACAAAGSAGSARSRSRAADDGSSRTTTPRGVLAQGIARLGARPLPWTKSLAQWRDRVIVPAPGRRRRMARPLRRGARRNGDGVARACARRQDRARRTLGADELAARAARSAALEPAPPPRRRGADPFRRAVRLVGADRLRGGGRAEAFDPRAGAVRPRPPSDHRRRPGAAGGRAAVARAPAGAGDARPARLLARQLRRGQSRDEGPLSAPSLARRSARRPPTRRAKPRGE